MRPLHHPAGVLLVGVVAFLFACPPASAQPLVDRVPAGALVYVGWGGTEGAASAFGQSRLKAVLESTDAHRLLRETLPAIGNRIAQEDPDAAEAFKLASAIGTRVWRHPSAFYFAGIDQTNPRRPVPKMAILCDAGADSAALLKEVEAAIAKAGKSKVPVRATQQGTMVAVTFGPEQPGVAGQQNLAADAKFKDALSKVHASGAVAAVYVNVEAIVKLIDTMPQPGNPQRAEQQKQQWIKVRDALGLTSAKSVIWTGAFDQKDWTTRAFVAAPSPRAGVFTLMDGPPITDDLLGRVPDTASLAAAGTFDPAKLVAGARATAGKIDPKAPAQLDQALDQFRAMTGLDLEKDVLEPLGPQWCGYSDPHVGGSYAFTGVLMNKLDDPAKADASLKQLSQSIANLASGAMAQAKMQLAVREHKDGDIVIRYFALPIVRPAWTIKDGVLYAGLYPQVVSSAVAHGTGGKSILQNESFTSLRSRLGGKEKLTAVRYVDLPKTAPLMYTTWLVITSYGGFGDMFGVPTPAMLLPPLDDLLKNLAPAGAASWVDDAGWHMSGVSPFPGAQLIASDPTLNVGGGALMASILLPSLNRARETANRVKCASNMRQIGQGILLYSNDNRGKYPPDLGTLFKSQADFMTPEIFTCPSSYNDVPAEIVAGDLDAKAAWVNANASYVYVGAGMNNTAGAEEVVLYEKGDNHDEDGMNFLFGDGHVEWNSMPVAEELIQKAGAKAPAQ